MEALRQLAARPGTPAEGEVAARKLAELQERKPVPVSVSAFEEIMEAYQAVHFLSTCACGTQFPINGPCRNLERHLRIHDEIRERFPVGMRVYYNRWAYQENARGVVRGYTHYQSANWQTWGWIRLKFDHLKSVRAVPIYSQKGWHLSAEPLSPEAAEALRNI